MFIGFGDLAQSHQMRRLTSDAKAEVTRLSQEVTTGVTANPTMHLHGNLRPLASIEATLSNLESYQTRTKEAVLQTSMMQAGLEVVDTRVSDVLQVLTSTVNFPTGTNLDVSGNEAEMALRSIFQALNVTGPAGAAFSGVATDQPPFPDFQLFQDTVTTIANGTIDADMMINALDFFFDKPSGFNDQIYQGSNQALSNIKVGATTTVQLNIRANQSEVVETLKGLTFAYLANAVPDTFNAADREQLANAGYQTLLQSQTGINEMRADVGRAQNTLDTTLASNDAQRTSYQLARQALIGIDPYEAATALEEQQTQLETIYAITARLSRLNLTDFL